MANSIIRLPAVMARTGLTRSSVYLGMRRGTFPQHIQLGGRMVGWLEEDIEAWIEQRIEESKGKCSDGSSNR